jgi:hypothetical protein
MDISQFIIFLIIISLSFLKAIAFKKCSNDICPLQITLFLSFILMCSSLILLPTYYENFVRDLEDNREYLLIPIIKGILYFVYLYYSNVLSRYSGSSRAIAPVIGVGLIAFINYFLLGESLNINQLISAILITFLGVFYYFKGHISENLNSKIIFLKFLGLLIILSVLDHWGNSTIHWFSYLLLSTVVVYMMNFIYSKDREKLNIKEIFNKKMLLIACLIYVITEVYVTSVRVNEIPVTIVNIAVLMTSPIIMIYMNVTYKESTLKKQLSFGLVAFCIGLFAIF